MISLLALAKALNPVFCWTHGVLRPPSVPVNLIAPAISGAVVQVGNTVNCSNGTWANAPTSYAFQWQNEGANLTGAGNPTTNAYTLQATDIGCLITCAVTATNGFGASMPAISGLAGPTLGTTVFYVSMTDGLDTNDGTTSTPGAPHGPWKTLTHVNAQSFTAGTSVLFKRGDTWRTDGCSTSSGAQLSPASSGSSGNPIVFDAYGTGAMPTIDGSIDLSSTGAWTLTGTPNVWQSNHTFNGFSFANGLPNNRADDPGNLIWGISAVGGTNVPPSLVNAHYGVMAGTGVGNIWWASGQAGLNATGKWNFNTSTNKIQVFCTSNPATGLPGVNGDLRAAIDTCLIYFNQQHDIIIQNFTLNYSGATAIDTGGAGGSCSNIIIRDCVVQWIGGGNISGASSANSRYGDGWDMEGSMSGGLAERIWWHQVFDTGPGPQCGGGPHQDNITVRNNVCSDCGAFFSTFFLGGVPTCSGLSIYNNTVYCTQNAWSNNPSQRPNASGFENVYALTVGTVNWDSVHSILTVQSNMYIANNIFAGIGGINPMPGFGLIATSWFATGSPANSANPFTASGPGGTGAWLDYNCWPINIQTGSNQQIALHSGNFDISAWIRGINTPGGSGTFAPRLETNGVLNQDPLFVSQSGLNFALQAASPCQSTGVNLYSTNPSGATVPPCAATGMVWDFNHNPRPSSGPFSIGAFQGPPSGATGLGIRVNVDVGAVPTGV